MRARLVRGRRHRGRDDTRAGPGAEASTRIRGGVRDRGDRAPHARGDRGEDPDPRPRIHPGLVPRPLGWDREGGSGGVRPRREGGGEGCRVRGRRPRDRLRHPRREGARRPNRSGRRRVRAGPRVRGHLGTDDRPDGGCADPARRRAAPARVDRAAAGARSGPRRGDRPPDPPAPGRLAVLPAAGRSLRARELSARADPVRAGRPASVPRRRAAAEHRAVHARGLRRGGGGERSAPAAGAGEGRRLDGDQRDVLVHAGHGLDRGRVGRRPRVLDLRGRVGDARGRDGTDGGRVDRGRRALDGPRQRPTRTGSTRS